jgi:hypothetical protein
MPSRHARLSDAAQVPRSGVQDGRLGSSEAREPVSMVGLFLASLSPLRLSPPLATCCRVARGAAHLLGSAGCAAASTRASKRAWAQASRLSGARPKGERRGREVPSSSSRSCLCVSRSPRAACFVQWVEGGGGGERESLSRSKKKTSGMSAKGLSEGAREKKRKRRRGGRASVRRGSTRFRISPARNLKRRLDYVARVSIITRIRRATLGDWSRGRKLAQKTKANRGPTPTPPKEPRRRHEAPPLRSD